MCISPHLPSWLLAGLSTAARKCGQVDAGGKLVPRETACLLAANLFSMGASEFAHRHPQSLWEAWKSGAETPLPYPVVPVLHIAMHR